MGVSPGSWASGEPPRRLINMKRSSASDLNGAAKGMRMDGPGGVVKKAGGPLLNWRALALRAPIIAHRRAQLEYGGSLGDAIRGCTLVASSGADACDSGCLLAAPGAQPAA